MEGSDFDPSRLKSSADKLLVFKWLQAQVNFFSIHEICCVYVTKAPHYQTDLARENSATYLKMLAGMTFSYHLHALITLYVQFLCSDFSKFDRWVHAENLCSILKPVYFDS